MIRPGWIAHPNLSLWSQACHQLHGEPNGSGSAWCVKHLHASAGCDRRERAEWGSRLAEDKCAHQLHERWVAADSRALVNLVVAGKPVLASAAGRDRGVRLRDIDGDGRLEIVVLTQQQLHVITAGGLAAAAFPATIPTHHEAGQLFGEPVAGDLDGNGAQEIYAAASIGIYGIGADGDLLPGFPLLTSASPVYTPLLADIDGDGAVDVAAAADDAVYVWQPLSWNGDFASGTASAWAQAGGTAAGTRAYFAALGDPPSTQTGQLLPAARSYCYPNPVDGDTDKATVRFYLARDASVTLHVYDAIGTQVDGLAAADLRGAAENEVSWSTDGYSSGLYLCRLTATGVDGSRGEVTLRMAVSR